jgi:trk system potassium uptake protein TrkA
VSWTSARALRHVLPDPGHSDWIDPTSTYALVERKVLAATAGVSVGQLDEAGLRVVLLTRTGAARLPDRALLVQQDDLIHLLVRADATADVDRALLEIGAHR